MTNRIPEERGWVLTTAISLLAVMLIVAFSSLAIVDTQQKRDRQQRERESSLNLAEAALYQQGFKLAQTWPDATTPAVDCSSTVVNALCPTGTQVQSNVNNVDTAAGTTWTTQIRDNGYPLDQAFTTAQMNSSQSATAGGPIVCPGPCRIDANGDKKMWVRAQAVVRGRVRTIVATLKLEQLAESIPETAVVAGGINTGNNGAQTKIYAVGSSVVVRCTPPAPSGSTTTAGNDCVSDPDAIQPSAVGGNPGPLMDMDKIRRFRAAAKADHTYYPGCPPVASGNNFNLTGKVVFVENCTDYNAGIAFSNNVDATCKNVLPAAPTPGGNPLQPDCVNSIEKPGMVIWHCGALGTSGKGTYIGLMYFVNGSDNDPDYPCSPKGGGSVNCDTHPGDSKNVLETTGGLGILGAVAIDGNGCLYASANGIQVEYDARIFDDISSYGTVGLVQDTWRELIPN